MGEVAGERERARAKTGRSRFTVMVDDDGPGLTEAQRKKAVKRGQRLDESKPGSGLGLSIVADLAHLYKGRFELEPSPGRRLARTARAAGRLISGFSPRSQRNLARIVIFQGRVATIKLTLSLAGGRIDSETAEGGSDETSHSVCDHSHAAALHGGVRARQ